MVSACASVLLSFVCGSGEAAPAQSGIPADPGSSGAAFSNGGCQYYGKGYIQAKGIQELPLYRVSVFMLGHLIHRMESAWKKRMSVWVPGELIILGAGMSIAEYWRAGVQELFVGSVFLAAGIFLASVKIRERRYRNGWQKSEEGMRFYLSVSFGDCRYVDGPSVVSWY